MVRCDMYELLIFFYTQQLRKLAVISTEGRDTNGDVSRPLRFYQSYRIGWQAAR